MFHAASFSGPVEIREGLSPRRSLSHVLFDFDGTLSWIRHGWPNLMCDLFMPHCPLLPGATEADWRNVLLEEILLLNGESSVHQVRRCCHLIRERGGRILEPGPLLSEYLRRLDHLIAERIERIRAGTVDDFIIRGARAFLETLRSRGLTLAILSGTIEHRVKEEAELLGLAEFFGNHIYGSTANGAVFSKRAVLERLLRQEHIDGQNLLSFGDGPVEIALTRRNGGLAVAIASDEEVNGSGKLAPYKLRGLRAAGADIILPDFQDAQALTGVILGPPC
ncbi:MAG TPA: HAD family hydrolase [Clostridia bacterium]|nr:HAD family hydrolase [Clostridia bacterium]